MHALALPRVVPGSLPLPDVFEFGAVIRVPAVYGGLADGIEQVTGVAPGDGAEGDRGIGRPEGGGADLGNGRANCLGNHG